MSEPLLSRRAATSHLQLSCLIGSAEYGFRAQDGIGVDEVMDEAIDAGATEITMDEGQIVVDTDPAQVSSVAKQMEGSLKLQVERSEILFVPKEESLVELDEERSEEVQNVLNLIDEEPSLQSLYVNMT